MSELHMLILAALMDIHRFGPKDKTLGICANVIKLVHAAKQDLLAIPR